MCGISGKLTLQPDPTLDQLVNQMNHVLRHRGPDDDGVWVGGNGRIVLGQRRLAIVDLSPNGRQPMSNEDGSIWITFNGEIYNHPALRPQLEAKGHQYRGASDTETILHLYEEYGRECVTRLRGMFAFALWDEQRQLLLLARDRFGKKPLVYAETTDGLIFASELKALLQDERVSRDIDQLALHYYLTYGFIPTPQTIFGQIRKLPPAHTLVWQNGQISLERYWSLDYLPKLNLSEAEATEQLVHHLREVVQIRLMSDVPLGAFLSGGIDSSAVVAFMAEAMSEPVKTFSIGFRADSYNETAYARQVAAHFQTDHQEFVVEPDALAILPELVWGYGEPFADSSALPTYYVAKMTRHYVTVALNGDGGDELFGGYTRYQAHRLALTYDRLPDFLRQKLLPALVGRLPESDAYNSPTRRLKHFLLAQNQPLDRRYGRWLTLMDDAQKSTLYTSQFAAQMRPYDAFAPLGEVYGQTAVLPWLDRLLHLDTHSYLPDDLLVKVDIATMIHSLEGRSPFLDHKLAEFVARLPIQYKIRGRQGKYLLKKALTPYLPPEILRRPKQGFAAPLAGWFRQELKETVRAVLLDERAIGRGIFAPTAVGRLLDEHISGKANHRYPIWQLLMLELWFRAYIDRPRDALTAPPPDLF
jgi:asparagine synthase (glutamine-hydrolysing)